MSGNTFGKIFMVTTAGESHGEALLAIVDGCPSNLEISEDIIQKDLDRRKPGSNKFTTQRKEKDKVKILSGIFEGKTTGTPIGLLIYNEDQKSKDYSNIKDVFRPNHADWTYFHKYGIRDYRGGGRSSARETSMRVAAGAIAKSFLKQKGIEILAFVNQIGKIKIPFKSFDIINQNSFFVANNEIIYQLEEYINQVRSNLDSVGAKLTVIVKNVPIGLGNPIFDRLDSNLAYALMSINAVKSVSIGDGDIAGESLGSEFRDELNSNGFISNHCGGILGGISSGQDIIVHIQLKPTPSIAKPGKTVNTFGEEVDIVTKGRHDPCVGIRAVPIAEAMVALTLIDSFLINQSYK